MPSEDGTMAYFQIGKYLVGGIFHSWGGMVSLEDFMVPSLEDFEGCQHTF